MTPKDMDYTSWQELVDIIRKILAHLQAELLPTDGLTTTKVLADSRIVNSFFDSELQKELVGSKKEYIYNGVILTEADYGVVRFIRQHDVYDQSGRQRLLAWNYSAKTLSYLAPKRLVGTTMPWPILEPTYPIFF